MKKSNTRALRVALVRLEKGDSGEKLKAEIGKAEMETAGVGVNQ